MKISRRQMLAAIAAAPVAPAVAASTSKNAFIELPAPIRGRIERCSLTVLETRSNRSFTRMLCLCPSSDAVQGIIVNGTPLPDASGWFQESVGAFGQELRVLVPSPLWFSPLDSIEVIAEFEPRKHPPHVLHEGLNIEGDGSVVTYTSGGVAFRRNNFDL